MWQVGVSPPWPITGLHGLNFHFKETSCQESTVTWHHPSLLQMSELPCWEGILSTGLPLSSLGTLCQNLFSSFSPPFSFLISYFHLFLIILNWNDSKSTYTQSEILVAEVKEFRSKCPWIKKSRKGNLRLGKCCWTETYMTTQPAQQNRKKAF